MTKMLIDRSTVEQALHVATAAGYPVALIAALRAALTEEALQKFTDVNQELEAALAEPTTEHSSAVEPVQEPVQEPVRLQCTTCGTVYTNGVPPKVPEQKPFGYLWPTGRHPEFRFTQQKRDGVDGMPVYASPAPTAEDIAQDWDLLKATQESLREHMAEIQRLRAALAEPVQEPIRLNDGRIVQYPDGTIGVGSAPPQRPAEPVQEPDLSRCPKCNGPADNGHDREAPPNPYYCTKCMAEQPVRFEEHCLWARNGNEPCPHVQKAEPVATKNENGITLHSQWDSIAPGSKLYTSPPQRKENA